MGTEECEACQKILKDGFKIFFEPATETESTQAVVDSLEFSYSSRIHTFAREVAKSGTALKEHASESKPSMLHNSFINPPGFSHLRQGYLRHYM